MPRLSALGPFLGLALLNTCFADEALKNVACRSVHLRYQAPRCTAFYNEVTVSKSSEGTYFEVCGWNKGYFGIQQLGNGKKLVLFSVWDPSGGNDAANIPPDQRVKMLYKDPLVRTGRFGGEGTGGQAFFDYEWHENTPYRFLVTATADGLERTAYTGYFFVPEDHTWKRLVTFSTLTKTDELLRGQYSFVEDFLRNGASATRERKAEFGDGWVKSMTDGWRSLEKARFTADANPVLNIDAGTTGKKFFLATGGMTTNTSTKLNEMISCHADPAKLPTDLEFVRD